jgi:nicotinate-nucleotide pyrophosphorylase (carboxylating)
MTCLMPDVTDIIERALAEDIGTGDVTTQFTVPEDRLIMAEMNARTAGIAAGIPVAVRVFQRVDPSLVVTVKVRDGESVSAGDTLLTVSGDARAILTAERTALNFVQRLSGIATRTAVFVNLVEGTSARIVDTRKTAPGLRALEKYAVRCGGGHNHRFGLYDAVMIKDNHIAACGSIAEAVKAAYTQAPHTMTVTVECDTLGQVEEAIAAGADIIMLDNMSVDEMKQAVEMADGQAAIEASGGVNEKTVAEIAAAGVDIISVGALTHSVASMDIGLDITIS